MSESSDVTGAAVQVRLEGLLFAELELEARPAQDYSPFVGA